MAPKTIKRIGWLFGVWVLLGLAANSLAVEWQVDLTKPRVAKFISRAPLEEFEGITEDIDGYLYWEDDSLFKNNEFYFEVNLNTLDTGIGLRNRHMRERYLETDKWPVASYQGKIVDVAKRDSAGLTVYEVQTQGTFSVHGVERDVEVAGTVEMLETGLLRIKAAFQIELPDYNIKIPQVMFFKLNKVIKIRVMFHLKRVDGE